MKSNAGTVSAYIEALPPERRRVLTTLREMIEHAAPKAKGSMKLGSPTWELNGPLFALASKPNGIELYVAEADLIAERKKSFGEVEVGTASIRFKRIEDVNLAVVASLLADAVERRKGGATAPRA